jgi:hypothetical protein
MTDDEVDGGCGAGASGVGPYRAIRYSMIATDSTIVTPPSWIAGMNPAGLTARNSASD